MEFEWDPEKERTNIAKHHLDFQTAARVFLDPFQQEVEDARDYDEIRWNAIGMVDGRVLIVTYTMRGARYRIISARGATPRERRAYHDIQA